MPAYISRIKTLNLGNTYSMQHTNRTSSSEINNDLVNIHICCVNSLIMSIIRYLYSYSNLFIYKLQESRKEYICLEFYIYTSKSTRVASKFCSYWGCREKICILIYVHSIKLMKLKSNMKVNLNHKIVWQNLNCS